MASSERGKGIRSRQTNPPRLRRDVRASPPSSPSKTPSEKETPGNEADSAVHSVVGIGASAGGLEAFCQVLQSLPATTGMSFVFVQHLAPKHESFLPELLSAHTSMP